MRRRRTFPATVVAVAASGALPSTPAGADVLGGLDGRSVDPASLPTLSAEVSWVADDDVSVLGFRLNYKLDAVKVGFLTAGLTEFDDSGADGYLLGAGLYYHLSRQRLSDAVDLALKPSVGYQSAEGNGAEVDGFVAALELVASGRRAHPVDWYANVGVEYAYIDTNNAGDDGDVDGLIGAGVYAPVGPGQIYTGVDYSGEFGLGAGYRLFF